MKGVPISLLKAFGFVKSMSANFSSRAWYQPELEFYYDPKIHTERLFARNLINSISHYKLSDEAANRTRKILDMKPGEW